MIGVAQIGHRWESIGICTVNMGNSEDEDIGGSMRLFFSDEDDEGRCFSSVDPCLLDSRLVDGGRLGSTGGGNSMFSAAFCDNCRAKSDAYHHSRNFSANMLVGSKILSEDSKRGLMLRAMFLGANMEPPSPGRAGPTLLGCVANAMALWSASPSLLIRVPISHRKGDEYFVPSNK